MDGAGCRAERDRDGEGAARRPGRGAERGGKAGTRGWIRESGTGGGEVKTLDVMFDLWCWFVLILLGLMIGGVR